MSKRQRTRAYRTPLANVVALVASLAMVIGGVFVPVTATATPGGGTTDEVATTATVEPSPDGTSPAAEPTDEPTDEVTPEPVAEPTDEATDEATPTAEPSATASPSPSPSPSPTADADPCAVAEDEDGNAVESEATKECANELDDDELVGGTITSDKDTYAPGGTVVLSGAGWTDDGKVAIEVVDAATGDVVHAATVDVTGSGSVFTTFALPTSFSPSFDVTAKGKDSKELAELSFAMALADVTIKSDLPDYMPGQQVTLTGEGWLGDETVRLITNDTIDKSWFRDVTVTVGEDGTITDVFNLPNYFISDYDVLAIGQQTHRTATWTFTDANAAWIKVRKGGVRTGVSTVENLSGAKFAAYAKDVSNNQGNLDDDLVIPSGATPVATCTTGPDGTCTMKVTWADNRTYAAFIVAETDAPTGYNVVSDINSDEGDYYRFNVQVQNRSESNPYMLPSSDRWWANRKDNPAWPGVCAMNIALLFDESTSISGTEWGQMKTAAKGIVDALTGTPSRIALFSFATTAPGGTTAGLAPVSNPTEATALKTAIDSMVQSGGYTNWDAGLYQIAQSAQSFDAVMFLTDGDPTRYGNGGSGSSVTIRNIEEAVHSANAVKAKGTRIVGVGIGVPSGSEKNLIAVTGPTEGSDYFKTTFDGLNAKLKEIIAQQCGGKVIVQKQIGTTLPGASGADTNGWSFEAGITSPSGGNAGSVTPTSGSTGVLNNTNGGLEFTFKGGTWPKTVTIKESSVSANYDFVTAQCLRNGQSIGSLGGTRTMTITGLAATDTVSCTFLNKEETGTLKIDKSFVKAGWTGNMDFTINYACTADNRAPKNGVVTITNSGTQSVQVPAGYSCVVTEPTRPGAPEGWTWSGDPAIAGSPAVIVNGQTKTVTVTNTLQANTGSLRLLKDVVGGPADFTGPFTIGYSCGTGFADTRSVSEGSPVTITGIPAGRVCQITEDSQGTAPTGYSWVGKTLPTDKTIVAGQTVDATVTNTLSRDTGKLRVTKTLSNPDGATVTAPFSVDVVCKIGATVVKEFSNQSVSAGNTITLDGIPTGATCVVTEDAPTGIDGFTWAATVITPTPSGEIVKAGDGPLVTVANTITRDTGSLVLAKSLNGGPAGYTGPFDIAYSCTIAGGDPISGSRSVAAGSSVTVTGIPTGYECVVSEPTLPTVPQGYTFGTATFTPTNATAEIGRTPQTVTTHNVLTRDLGNLVLSKSLSGGPSGYTGPFTIGYVCTIDGGSTISDTVSVTSGSSATVENIPTGYHCYATETVPTAPAGYTFGAPTFTPATEPASDRSDTVTIVKDASVTIATANSLTRDMGELTITKVLTGFTGEYGEQFPITFICEVPEDSAYTGGPITGGGTFTAGETKAFPIPTGYECVVTEGALPAPPQGWSFGTPTYSPTDGTVAITRAGGSFGVTVTNPLTRDLGTLRVTKTLAGGPDGFTGPFGVDYVCAVGFDSEGNPMGGEPIQGTLSLAAGANDSVTSIPTGWFCVVTEPSLPAAPSGFTWATPTISPTGGTVQITGANGVIVDVTVANGLNTVPPPPPPPPGPTPPVEPTPEPALPSPEPTVIEPTPEPAQPTPVEPTPEAASPVIPASVPAGDGPLGIPLWSWALLLAGFVGVIGAGIRLVTRKED